MSIKYAILGLLHYKNMHGYRIKEHIERNFGYMWSINYGQIYPNLKRLEADGLVTKKEIPQENAPDRKLYSLTDKGREEFTRWLSETPEREMLIRDPFLLRFIFFGFGDPETALEQIDRQIELYKKTRTKREQNMERWKDMDVYVTQVAKLGITFNDMVLQWLLEAREVIQNTRDETNKKASGSIE
ncbi:MAG: PadR family transcriptional regulator [Deltaproteobacteria bacterium]|nr:PadR family transcriptional regulator [Candidatus Zymogenaceae bacterium]